MSPREAPRPEPRRPPRGRAGRLGAPAHGPGAHADVELAWVDRGTLTCRLGGSELELPAGAALLIPAGVEHAVEAPRGGVSGSVWLARELVEGTARSLGLEGLEPTLIGAAEPVVRLADLLRAEVERRGDGWHLAADALAEALVVAVLRRARAASASTARDPRIEAAVERIERDFAEALSVDDLARTAGMSRFHFSRRFRDEVGESPYRFLLRVRLERAAERLRAGRSVTEAAYEVGFGGLGRFSRAFRERFGVLPSRYP